MRNNAARWLTLFTAMLALSFLANPRIAAAADDDDPPARAARLSFTGGAVSFEPAGTDEWVDAVINRPMTTGDKLWTDRDGRAEIRIDSYGLRLGPHERIVELRQRVEIRGLPAELLRLLRVHEGTGCFAR